VEDKVYVSYLEKYTLTNYITLIIHKSCKYDWETKGSRLVGSITQLVAHLIPTKNIAFQVTLINCANSIIV